MKNYKVVSGTPRSGTSINMRIHGTRFQLEGKKFPRIRTLKDSDSEFLKYIKDKNNSKVKNDLNPKGFFEDSRFCMTGISNNFRCAPLPKEGSCIKIIGKGLKDTDPSLISSVLFSLRHPFETAEAQLDLKNADGLSTNMWKRDLLNFIRFIQYFKVPYFVSSYTKLCQDPEGALNDYSNFYEEDFTPAISLLKGHKARKTPDLQGDEWSKVLDMYNLALKEDWEGVLEKNKKVLPTTILPCPRVGRAISKSECDMCYKNTKGVIKTLKRRAEKNEVNWDQEPCRVDCEKMTIQESINKNHWR